MKRIICTSPTETFTLVQAAKGWYCCTVCGSDELPRAPYGKDGLASFEMCSCGFEYGFDDDSFASGEVIEGVRANWRRWRRKLIDQASRSTTALARLERQLKNIGLRLAFDLIDVEDEKA